MPCEADGSACWQGSLRQAQGKLFDSASAFASRKQMLRSG